MHAIPVHLAGAYAHCARIARNHYENFPVASLLLPAPLRPHVAAVYAFARRADDFADEPFFADQRLRRLAAWERLLVAAAGGKPPRQPVFAALTHTLHAFELPAEPFFDLLSAFRQDVTVRRYDRFDDVRDYCRRSADPVGRIVLALSGMRDARRVGFSDAICTALQLANFWQDVAVDAQKDRIYIPLEDMARFGVTESDVLTGRMSERMRALMAFQVARTRTLFMAGKPLCDAVSGRLRLELRAVWLGGMGILDAIEQGGFDVYGRRPRHHLANRLRFVTGTLFPGRFARAYAGS